MKMIRQRKCRCCGRLYLPQQRNRTRQRYCSTPACQAASRKASQLRWLSKPKNRLYHGELDHCKRVRDWRKAHPGYWRKSPGALQDITPADLVVAEEVVSGLMTLEGVVTRDAVLCDLPSIAGDNAMNAQLPVEPARQQVAPLQDSSLAQNPHFVGLVAILTDALQDTIAPVLAGLQTRGQAILCKGPGITAERNGKS
jgi:hypothetical protein